MAQTRRREGSPPRLWPYQVRLSLIARKRTPTPIHGTTGIRPAWRHIAGRCARSGAVVQDLDLITIGSGTRLSGRGPSPLCVAPAFDVGECSASKWARTSAGSEGRNAAVICRVWPRLVSLRLEFSFRERPPPLTRPTNNVRVCPASRPSPVRGYCGKSRSAAARG